MNKPIIYSSPTCVKCMAAKKLFKRQGIEYDERDITKNREYAEELEALRMRSLPAIVYYHQGQKFIMTGEPSEVMRLIALIKGDKK
jgi:glutaredoxin